jgi:deoxyribodipyrimidine photolyase-related protein
MTLRLVLGDQLNINHNWFAQPEGHVTYTLMEVREEASYVRHHIQKVAGIFAAMRLFAEKLQESGHQVHYIHINDPNNRHSIHENISALMQQGAFNAFEYMEPDEYRVERYLQELTLPSGITKKCVSSEHFLADRYAFREVFGSKKNYLMETFYRTMRKKYGILMAGGKPVGGKWNLDAENRQKLPAKMELPELEFPENNMGDIYREIEAAGIETIGTKDSGLFHWTISREQALQQIQWFCNYGLACFGTYQDAMTTRSWALYHSRLSFALNIKLISPMEVIQAAVSSWECNQEDIRLNQIEGFVRQILGWREYMRCLYWAEMPEFAQLNFFSHERKLPGWFWTGDTRMRCMSHAINQSLDYAYAHHIQRLMITGNFALLAGVDPSEVDAWYLGIYADAFEWVEITNTRGMSQYADGGLTATKPYVSSASYIHKMSDYCEGCHYQKNERTGTRACPFNSLYWDFLDRNKGLLAGNQRMTMMYAVWNKMQDHEKAAILEQASHWLINIETL